jgi:predicted  nucleic acid-binding Zn-ribbon protein
MADLQPIKPKGFWERPEGVTGMVFGAGFLVAGGWLVYKILPYLANMAENGLRLGLSLTALAALIYVVLDPKMRNLIWYIYKSIMRWITGVFVQIDPIGILKSYVDDLRDNLSKMNVQIGKLRGQMNQLKTIMDQNAKDIQNNLKLASAARDSNMQAQMVLKSRKAGRLQDSNMKYDDLYKRMEILYRVLSKMYENSEVMVEDVQDQVAVKEQERKAIRASHSAMTSAMNIISGNSDKRYMFDMALEAIAEDVSSKVGEMERFMDMSTKFMDSIDLQNGVFEQEGMDMLEKWENEGVSMLLGGDKEKILLQANNNTAAVLDLNAKPLRVERTNNQYDTFFEN